MSDNHLPAVLASQVQDLLFDDVPISIDVINHDNIYLAIVTAFETHARIEGQELGFLVIGDELAATNNPADLIRIIKGVVGDFDNLSIHGTPTDEERSAIEEVSGELIALRH